MKKKKEMSEQLEDQTKELRELREKCDKVEDEVGHLKQQKTCLQKKVWHLQKSKSVQANKIVALKEHNFAGILHLEANAKELKEKNKELEQLSCLLEDDTISTFEDGKYVNEIREVIMELLTTNVSMNKVNDVIRIVLKKLSGKSILRLPSKAVHSRLLVEAKHIAGGHNAGGSRHITCSWKHSPWGWHNKIPSPLSQRSKLRPFWSPWRVEKKIGDQNCQEGRQFGDLFPDHLSCFNLHPDIIKSYDHKTVQCPLPS